MNALLTVGEVNTNTVFLVQVLSEVLCTIDGAVLTARAAEGEHEIGEAALQVTLNVVVSQAIDAIEKNGNLAVVLEEANNRSVQTCELLVRLVTTWVVCRSAVEDIASTIATLIFGNAAFIGEGEDADN